MYQYHIGTYQVYDSPKPLSCGFLSKLVWIFLEAWRNDRYPHNRLSHRPSRGMSFIRPPIQSWDTSKMRNIKSEILRPFFMANRLKPENGGLHLHGRVWPGKRANQARFSWVPTSHFARGIQRRLSFLQDIILKQSRQNSSFLQIRFGYGLFERQASFSDVTPVYIWKSFSVFFLRKWEHRKQFERYPWRKEKRV